MNGSSDFVFYIKIVKLDWFLDFGFYSGVNSRCMKDIKNFKIPLVSSKVHAGFPSPAEGYADKALDLNELVIKHPAATFFVRVEGESMVNSGIDNGDILVVDRSLTASDGCIAIVIIDGEFVVRRMKIKNGWIKLLADNPRFKAMSVEEDDDFQVWGVVSHVVKDLS